MNHQTLHRVLISQEKYNFSSIELGAELFHFLKKIASGGNTVKGR